MAARGLTYRDSGVDIDAADRLVSKIAKLAAATRTPEVVSDIGLFAAGIKIPRGYREPILMTATDGVGTKLALARFASRHETIGVDLVAMSVNDILTSGARPLCFLDYLSVGDLASVDAEEIIAGIAEGCRQSAASLVGGETAEMPGFYKAGEYDLAGFCVGVVERRKMITGSGVRPGQVVIGLASSGLHSNGYSLARKALGVSSSRSLASLGRRAPALGEDPVATLLEPTIIYVKPVLAALEKFGTGAIKAMAHITGGGLPGNLVRVLPAGCTARIDRAAMPQLPVFDEIMRAGSISRREMDRTFNCGVGYTLVVGARGAEEIVSFLRRRRLDARVIGRIEAGRRGVRYGSGS